jgi:hypothetical protein
MLGVAGRSVRGAVGRGAGRDAECVGSGGVGVVGRCCSMRSRSVGGTTRPGAIDLAGRSVGAVGADTVT